MDTCAFDILFLKNVPHLLAKIFFSLDYESYEGCLEVSNVWNDLLTSTSFQTKGKSVFHKEILKDGLKLYSAAKEGDTEKVQKLLTTGMINLNIVASLGSWTPLFAAAHQGHKDVVQLLFDRGAELNHADIKGLTPLHCAASNGKIDTARLLMDLGAQPQLTKIANNCFISMISYGFAHYAIIRVLLQAGADPNMTGLNGKFQLLVAASNGSKKLVQLLLQGGAKPNMGDLYGGTPLHWAARFGHKYVVKQLIDGGAELNSTNIWGATPLYRAVQGGKKEVVKLLVDNGADQNIADDEGKTPLTLAREKDDLNIVNVLTDQEPPNLLHQNLALAPHLCVFVVLIWCYWSFLVYMQSPAF